MSPKKKTSRTKKKTTRMKGYQAGGTISGFDSYAQGGIVSNRQSTRSPQYMTPGKGTSRGGSMPKGIVPKSKLAVGSKRVSPTTPRPENRRLSMSQLKKMGKKGMS